MFDLNFIRQTPEKFDQGLAMRGLEPMAHTILEMDAAHRAVQTKMQDVQARRNLISKEIGALKSRGEDASAVMAEVAQLKQDLPKLEEEERALGEELRDILLRIPNLPLETTPLGKSEEDNVEIKVHGEKPSFDFTPKQHFELGEDLGQMDFERAAKLSGSRFVILKGDLARLERAIGQYMIDLHTQEHGYQEVNTPVLVRSEALVGTSQLPKFEDDLFHTTSDHWLIPTAEVTLSNIYREEIIPAETLPIRLTALTQCFRAEAGAAGKDTRGMIRQHQFSKVELVSIVAPEDGLGELDRKTDAAEKVLQGLGLAYRVVELCAGDMGFGSRKTHDIEVWLPGQNQYREISSCSLCGDFQSRRMNMRMRAKDEKQTRFPHTLNGSGVAIGRALVAVMENYQTASGDIRVPDVLKPYMGGVDMIKA